MYYIQMIHEDGTVLHFEHPIWPEVTALYIARRLVDEVEMVPGPEVIGVAATTLN